MGPDVFLLTAASSFDSFGASVAAAGAASVVMGSAWVTASLVGAATTGSVAGAASEVVGLISGSADMFAKGRRDLRIRQIRLVCLDLDQHTINKQKRWGISEVEVKTLKRKIDEDDDGRKETKLKAGVKMSD